MNNRQPHTPAPDAPIAGAWSPSGGRNRERAFGAQAGLPITRSGDHDDWSRRALSLYLSARFRRIGAMSGIEPVLALDLTESRRT